MGRNTSGTYLVAVSLLVCFGGGRLSGYLRNGNWQLLRGSIELGWTESSWASIKPTKALTWVDCYDSRDGFECARLQVPLNYSDPEGKPAAIALIRLKANIFKESPEYLGPILFNPGGPGASGVNMVLGSGKNFAKVLGPQFDIVGFDPRGIARSTPRVSWYQSRAERELWTSTPVRELNRSSEDVATAWARSQINGQLAAERALDVLPHIQTDHTDKVHRMVIDGVVDVEKDNDLANWKYDLINTDDTLKWFFQDCSNAGPTKCSFYEPSPSLIAERLRNLYTSIIRVPIPVHTSISYGLVDYARLRLTIFSSLYSPFARWARLAAGLADLEAGNGTALYQMLEQRPFSCSCDPLEHAFDVVAEAVTAITCNDSDFVPPDLEDAEKHYLEAIEISEWGSLWTGMRIDCR
ncbi:hypothetical protein VNI00_016712 [Paramarasmius palmivorus]|uniref:AB hydrolase-1 domain-containing protein n=1 Tax=Paramarasmius palmivorus TaxID=297713 RepID=A0AAW0BCC1_9AGAR